MFIIKWLINKKRFIMEANELIKLLLGKMKRLRLGNLVFFWRLGQIAKRRVKKMTPKEKKAWKKKHPPTPGQKKARTEFDTNRKLVAHMSRQLRPLGVWRRLVEIMEPPGMNADNYLFHVNHKCMKQGKFCKFRPLMISNGPLLLPDNMSGSSEGDTITLRWTPDESATDRLHVAIIRDDERNGLIMIKTGYACRGDGTFAFKPRGNGGTVHVYPFFGSEGNGDFSPNDYFAIEN